MSNLLCLFEKYLLHQLIMNRCNLVARMFLHQRQCFHLTNIIVGQEHKSNRSFCPFRPYFECFSRMGNTSIDTSHVCFQNKCFFLRLCLLFAVKLCWIRAVLNSKSNYHPTRTFRQFRVRSNKIIWCCDFCMFHIYLTLSFFLLYLFTPLESLYEYFSL